MSAVQTWRKLTSLPERQISLPTTKTGKHKIDSKGSQMFSIPNTIEGRACIEMMKRAYDSGNFQLVVRPRGSRRGRYSGATKVEDAEWFAVYLYSVEYRDVIRSKTCPTCRQEHTTTEEQTIRTIIGKTKTYTKRFYV